MARKINYSEPKLQDLMVVLTALGFQYTKSRDSLDVTVDRTSRKVLNHELGKINSQYKTPPLTTQYDEAGGITSIFDSRM